MSRMDRYRHEKGQTSKQNSNNNIFARRQRRQSSDEDNDRLDDYEQDDQKDWQSFDEDYYEANGEFPEGETPGNRPKKKMKKKRKKKHPILRFILTLLILLIAYSGISFYIGEKVGESEDNEAPQAENFNGFSDANGGNNILLIGSDSRGEKNARADTIMVLQLDGPAKKPKLVSFMRDTYVNIPGAGDNKINASYAYGGADLVRQTLSENFGIDCKYYMTLDFETFEKVIDTLFSSGVDIDAEKDMSKNLETPIKKGPQKMDGLTLLQYARFRMDEEGDFGRVRRQQQVISAIFSELKNPIALLKLPYAAGKAMGYSANDVPMSFLAKNSFSIAKGASGIDRLSIPAEDTWSYGQSYDGSSVLIMDQQANQQAIQDFLAK
ncbi:LCP family protein [Tetragenococcus halophilus]|uniref:LCP family protein n=1 Tax=Tetragenococcus halophilus TaxID=51669 RepID=UPI000CAE0FB4|nr:LCP family protein [Tetragenococcus halophilus]QXN87873.1 LCP family protein [Tetragenococcus halophilus]GBD71949.1 putative LytR family regulatory protein [Tetragenococcus halophilus subsp. halophilus]GBD74983.1 putative LytR family regulatory protein [Tetragenococcus halophilus subsp. halophilus]